MGTLIIVYNSNNRFIKEIKNYLDKGFDVQVWGEQCISGASSLKLPNSKKYTEYSNLAQVKLNSFYEQSSISENDDIYRLDYIKKTMDLIFMDFVAFMKAVAEIQKKTKCIILAPSYLMRIYNNDQADFNSNVLYSIPSVLLRLMFMTLKFTLYTLTTKEKIETPAILYLRKKVFPDFSMSDVLQKRLREKNVSLSATYMAFGKESMKFGIHFLNAYKGMLKNIIFSSYKTVISIFKEVSYFKSSGIPSEFFVAYIRDSFIARIICGMKPKIMTGVLVDKPIFILLNSYKLNDFKIASLNESFFYPPFRTFDYNHIDTYYHMNDIDFSGQNRFGGNIKRSKQVDFFRKNLIANSKGISKEVQKAADNYNYITIIAPVQISNNTFGHWGESDLKHFLESCINTAKLVKDSLFILKEKKGELRLMPEVFMQKCFDLPNVLIIRSESPKFNEFDQFEDIIKLSNLVISMSLTSTTIWQAISHNIMAIAFNEIHPKSFLSEYRLLEVKAATLHESVLYWKNMKERERLDFIKTLSSRVKLGDSKGLLQIADDLVEITEK